MNQVALRVIATGLLRRRPLARRERFLLLLHPPQLPSSRRVAVYCLWLAGLAGSAGFVAAASLDMGVPSGLRVVIAGFCLIPVGLCGLRAALVRSQAAGVQREADGAEREEDGAEREEDGVQREAAGAQREAAGAQREADGAQREADGAQREEDLEESILRNAGEGISRLDNDGVVTFANPAASRMTGYSVGDLEGRFLHGRTSNTREDGSPYLDEVYPSADSTHHAQDVDVYWREDGTSFPVEFTSTPILKGSEVQGEVIVFKDITDRREAERAKNEFTAVVSHELRTPLTSIRGSLGLLDSGALGELPQKGQRMIKIAIENTDRLVRLINDILDLERINSGTIDMRHEPCNAAELVAQVVEEMQPVAAAGGLRLESSCAPLTLTADGDRIHQVLTNLISNAIKFSDSGATVSISGELSEGMVLFRVTDTGRGIPGDMLESIFERFSQVDTSDSREKGGTGLGLSICNTIVEHHRGRIWVESKLGEGSTFSFVLPVEKPFEAGPRPLDDEETGDPIAANEPTAAPAETEIAVAHPASVDGIREPGQVVLVVEDDLDLAEVLAATLRRDDINTFIATTGQEAIAMSQRVDPDLLVLDVGLPDTDGFGVVAWLRSHDSLKSLPMVVYTAHDLDNAARERLRLGGTTEFLTKGRISPEGFEARVTRVLGLTREPRKTVPTNV
jgi:PAS domain S-box-containing protein